MSTKFEHVIGRDSLHRIRKTRVENGEIIDCSHEGFSSWHTAEENELLVLKASLAAANIPWPVAEGIASCYAESFRDIPTVDERTVADPLEPQTPTA